MPRIPVGSHAVMTNFEVRAVTPEEFAVAADWAKAEGWNPGVDDLEAFFAADPQGFLLGFLDGEPVASISVVRYGTGFGFLGFYIVHPDHRGRGFGFAIWKAGMAYLEGPTIGLDGVVAQQDNYRRSGFVLAGRNIRHAGVVKNLPEGGSGAEIGRAASDDLDELGAYDIFPEKREAFLAAWLSPGCPSRSTFTARIGGSVAGFATVRRCMSGVKIGPLFADTPAVAADLVRAAVEHVGRDSEIAIDTPEDNPQAVALARSMGLEPVFETARMYRGPAPDMPLSRVFGITTFELG